MISLGTSHNAIPPGIPIEDVLDVVDVAAAGISSRLSVSLTREDLVSAGNLAVVRMLPNFSGSLEGARAACFVRARGAMLDEIRQAAPWSRLEVERVRNVRRIAHKADVGGRLPEAAEVAAQLGIALKAASRAIDILRHEADKIPDLDWIADEDAVSPADTAESGDAAEALLLALDLLCAQQAMVMRFYYLEEMTLSQVAKKLRVSEQRAHQIRNDGLVKLRKYFHSLGLWKAIVDRR